MVTAIVPWAPASTLSVAGAAETEKSGGVTSAVTPVAAEVDAAELPVPLYTARTLWTSSGRLETMRVAVPSGATNAEPSERGWLSVASLASVARKVTLPRLSADCGAGETWTVKTVLPEASPVGAAVRVVVVRVVVVVTALADWLKAADASARTAAATGSARKDQREDDRVLREADCKSKSLVEPRRSNALPKRGVDVLYLRRSGNGWSSAGWPFSAAEPPAVRGKILARASGMRAERCLAEPGCTSDGSCCYR